MSIRDFNDYLSKKSAIISANVKDSLTNNSLVKKFKVNKVKSLLGNARDRTTLCNRYEKMVRIVPEEFDISQMSKLKGHIKNKLQKPDRFYQEQARINPKFHKKIINIENIVKKERINYESCRC